jgi:hypothetical protein
MQLQEFLRECREHFPESTTTPTPVAGERSDPPTAGRILVSGTHTDTPAKLYRFEQPTGPHWSLKITDFGSDVQEIHAVYRQEPLRRTNKTRERKAETRAEMTPDNLERAGQRAKSKARKAVVMMQADTMMTLTYQENMTDIERAWTDWGKFRRILSRRYSWAKKYVAVHELQERGAVHFHVSLRTAGAWIPYNTIIKVWRTVIGGGGSVNFKRDFHVRTRATSGRIASYIAKYINKEMSHQTINRKRYDIARGMEKPETLVLYLPIGDDTFLQITHLMKQISGRLPSFTFTDTGVIHVRSY